MVEEHILSLEQVAEILNCTLAAVRRWRREGRIAVIKLGKLVRVRESEVQRIIRDGLPAARRSR